MPAADHPVPRHPGRILLEDYLIPMRLSQYDAAKRLYAPESTVNGVVAGTEKLTWSLAKRMSAVFGKTPKFWMESQRAWDKWRLEHSRGFSPLSGGRARARRCRWQRAALKLVLQ